MKKYKLLKDTPTHKAGSIFVEDGIDVADGCYIALIPENRSTDLVFAVDDINNFDEWFEEIKNQTYYYLSADGDIMTGLEQNDSVDLLAEGRKSIGNYFETRQQAEKVLARRQAEVILREDAKGFVPDWSNKNEPKYNVFYDCYSEEFNVCPNWGYNHVILHFKTKQDAEESIEKHEKEWKIYLGVE